MEQENGSNGKRWIKLVLRLPSGRGALKKIAGAVSFYKLFVRYQSIHIVLESRTTRAFLTDKGK